MGREVVGTADVTALPEQIKVLRIERCSITGTLDLGGLPQSLRKLAFTFNAIAAIENVHNLPSKRQVIEIGEASVVDKSLHIGKLPEDFAMQLSGCALTEVTFAHAVDENRVLY